MIISSCEKLLICNTGGCYLGYRGDTKYRVFVPGLNPRKVEEIENNSEDDADLARKLFRLVFEKELRKNPESVYCTEVDGKEQLNQEYLKGIRCKYA